MARPTPTNQESPFGIEELFFSKTDPHGVIESGNDVFVRVSGYPREQMLGVPHNLIRHPEMPRSVFKLFWDTLQQGQPIGAYVKNLAASGAYYWVFACAFPVKGGYLSIRLKPSTPLLELMPSLYAEVRELEARDGMDAGIQRILERLKEKGFASYQAFMTHALTLELGAREAAMSDSARGGALRADRAGAGSVADSGVGGGVGMRDAGDGDEPTRRLLQRLAAHTDEAARAYGAMFRRLDRFSQGSRDFEERTAAILTAYRELGFLSFNMAIAAEGAGEQGRALAVIAVTFQQMAAEIQAQLAQFKESMQRLMKVIEDSRFRIAAACLQVEMSEFFVQELLGKPAGQGAWSTAEIRKSCEELFHLAGGYSSEARDGLAKLQELLRQFASEREELEASVVGLEVIRQTGSVEAARSVELKAAFDAHIEQMRNFVVAVKQPTRSVGDVVASLLGDVQETLSLIGTVGETFRKSNAVLSSI
ncbi:MAG: PAS domain-containing protein [Oligoflexia bacterium]|nr:PAS domain-containing protein [Oligoflexia bacterium]